MTTQPTAGRAPAPDVLAWRRIALQQQLPDARFPAGVRAPSRVALAGMVVLACLWMALSAASAGRQAPRAIIDSQHAMVEQLVRALELGVQRDLSDVDRAVVDFASAEDTPPSRLFDRLLEPGSPWTGAAIIETSTRQSLAKSGAEVGVSPDVDLSRRLLRGSLIDGKPSVTMYSPLDDGHALVTVMDLRLRSQRLNPEAQQALYVGDAAGTALPLQGAATLTPELESLVAEGLRGAASQGRTVALSRDTSGSATIVTSSAIGDTGLFIVSATRTAFADGGAIVQALIPVTTLLIVAVVCFVLTRLTFLRPVAALLEQAKADACGATLRRARFRGPREAVRIAAALAGGRAFARGMPVMLSLVLVCAIVLGWSAGVLLHYGRQQSAVPAQVVSDEANRAEAIGHEIGAGLDLGYKTVLDVAAQADDLKSKSVEGLLERTARHEKRFRAMYVVDAAGKVLVGVGRDPLRRSGMLPGERGIWVDRANTRIPVIYAYHTQNDGTGLVAEFDVDYLVGVLRHMAGHVRIVDSTLSTVLDTDGYLAYEVLTGEEMRGAAMAALVGDTTATTVDSGPWITGQQLVSSAAVAEPASVKHLEWAVVAQRSVVSVASPETMRFRFAALVAGIATTLALFVLGWQYFALVRPLRALARQAEEVVAGQYESPISLRRPDEIGAIAACLEICRQVAVDGSARFGGAIRLRGSDSDYTTVLPRITEDRGR